MRRPLDGNDFGSNSGEDKKIAGTGGRADDKEISGGLEDHP
jgi:hypothetical protein